MGGGGGGTPGPEAYLSEESDVLVMSQSYNILGFIFVESKNSQYSLHALPSDPNMTVMTEHRVTQCHS